MPSVAEFHPVTAHRGRHWCSAGVGRIVVSHQVELKPHDYLYLEIQHGFRRCVRGPG